LIKRNADFFTLNHRKSYSFQIYVAFRKSVRHLLIARTVASGPGESLKKTSHKPSSVTCKLRRSAAAASEDASMLIRTLLSHETSSHDAILMSKKSKKLVGCSIGE
jgi:hypothetical protein